MDRREFLKTCSAGAVALAAPSVLTYAEAIEFPKAKLIDAQGNPIKASQLAANADYIFAYPYQSVPCILVNLGQALETGEKLPDSNGGDYQWLGGVGSDKSIVAFVGICQHQLQYPNKQVSMINFIAKKSDVAGRSGVINCCAHNSVYDPFAGGRVVKGPAPNPLMAVRLEWDAASDELTATGIYGHDIIKDFFKAYKRKLKKEYGRRAYKQEVAETTQIIPGREYSAMQVMC